MRTTATTPLIADAAAETTRPGPRLSTSAGRMMRLTAETTMNPEHRALVQVQLEDAERADAIFTKLMGNEVSVRKNFIQANAAKVSLEELDI